MSPDKVNWGYSTKNIPYPSDKEYRQILIEKTSKFLKNARWKAFYFLRPNQNTVVKENYGFQSEKNPPEVPELKPFENRIISLVENVQFRKKNWRKGSFQHQMSKDIKKFGDNISM